MTGSIDLLDFLAGQMADVETGWSIGTFGAIAEFTRDADEAAMLMLPWTNASSHCPPLYARRKPPARSAGVPLEEARSSSSSWEARANARRIVTFSFSVRVGAVVRPKSGCLRCWKACGRVSQLRCVSVKGKWVHVPAHEYITDIERLSSEVCFCLKDGVIGRPACG